MTSMAPFTAGDLVTVTSRSGRDHVRTAYGVVLDWMEHTDWMDHSSPGPGRSVFEGLALVMIDGEQVWCDHTDMMRLNDHA